MSAKVQRLRSRYERGQQVQYVSHLDMMRFWERALRRARIPVAYSEGFTPHPQIALCAPLSVGMTSRAELLDVFLAESLAAEGFKERLQAQLPPGIRICETVELPIAGAALQALVRAADYAIRLRPALSLEIDEKGESSLTKIEARMRNLLAADSIPWEHKREKDVKQYDLRPLVLELRLDRTGVGAAVIATLRADEGNTGRPDQLAAALGISEEVTGIERLNLILAEPALTSA